MRGSILFLLALLLGLRPAYSGKPAFSKENPLFFGHDRQVALHLGGGVNSGFIIPPPEQFVPFFMAQFQYSLPNTFFEFPARQSLNVAQTVGMDKKYGWHWNEFSIPIAFLSGDVAFARGKNWYAGLGAGFGMQARENARIGSKLLFEFKLFAGYRLTESVNGEFFIQHFSNGCTTDDNHSYAFYGLGVAYNF
ncbi:MAG: acyloxyacyl hydrolase [Rickettsiales bacterium]|nr:acyloxyacyl hydrolase [Rickettsiales bacterium]